MIIMDKLEFVALTHDLGKVFDRKNHQKVIVTILLDRGIADYEIINYLRKFHQRGNGRDYLYLVKYADQFSSGLQRVNSEDFLIPQGRYYDYLKRIFMKQLKTHFWYNYLNVDKLRRFIENNQILEQIPSDVRDVSKTSLREHLLLTDQVFCLLVKAVEVLPCSDCLYEWVRTKDVNDYLFKSIRRVPRLRGKRKDFWRLKRQLDISCIPGNPKFNEAVTKLNSYGWEVDKIALHFGLLESEVRDILSS